MPRRKFSVGTSQDRSWYGDAMVYYVWGHPELGEPCESTGESFPIVVEASSRLPHDA
jgi:hypothetical protein